MCATRFGDVTCSRSSGLRDRLALRSARAMHSATDEGHCGAAAEGGVEVEGAEDEVATRRGNLERGCVRDGGVLYCDGGALARLARVILMSRSRRAIFYHD